MNTFSLILILATLFSAVCYVYDRKKDRPIRLKNVVALKENNPNATKKEIKKLLEPTNLVGQIGSMFPIILFVFIFRSFIIEPFRIPSGSMMPTLLSGDFIAVTKWSYGFKDPLSNAPIIKFGDVERGDVIVFKYPEDPSVDFIKRVVGLPGDEVIYKDKNIYIKQKCEGNDCKEPVLVHRVANGNYIDNTSTFDESYNVYTETLLNEDGNHQIMINPNAPEYRGYFYRQTGRDFGSWVVPDGQYFALGDNRDNSRDSRFWGFVPREYIKGKAVFVWLSLEFDRDETDFLPSWIPSNIRFDRIGGIE